MAEHIWTVLCARSLVDADTNNVSLIDVIEQLTLTGDPPDIPPDGKPIILAGIQLTVVSLWTRTDPAQPDRVTFRVIVITPDGKRIIPKEEHELDLESHRRVRVFVRLNSFPYRGPGDYEWLIEERQQTKSGKPKWTKVARIPLEIRFAKPEQGSK
ncbi:MAG: hypothetical protein WA970_14945 [Gammaproteobacteria bacterium]